MIKQNYFLSLCGNKKKSVTNANFITYISPDDLKVSHRTD